MSLRHFLFAGLLTLQAGAAHATPERTVASVYHPSYHGGRTACGQRYDHWGISAAHAWLPCGTKVTIRHAGRSLVVPITDRCACSPRIDLSAGAAVALGVPVDGIAPVTIRY
jgi:rare lipoprotein A